MLKRLQPQSPDSCNSVSRDPGAVHRSRTREGGARLHPCALPDRAHTRRLADSPTRRVEPWAHLRDVFCLLPDWPARDARPRAPTQGQVRRTQRRSRSTRGERLPPPHARLISLTTNQLEERGSLSRYEGPHRRGAAPAVAGRPRFESSCCRTASGPACARQQAPDRPPG